MSEQRPETPIPPAIAAGIVQVMASVKRLARTDENKFSHYNYASIDSFLEAMGPLLAEAGLFILPEEDSLEIIETEKKDREGTTGWLRMVWSFTLGHASGATYGPLHRSVIVPAAGAQAFGSSLSYALKQFMRGVFQIPTGDADDPDQFQKTSLPKQTRASSAASANRADAWRAIDEAPTPMALLAVAERIRDSKGFSPPVKKELLDHAAERMLEFGCGSVKKVETIEQCEKAKAFYGGLWLLGDVHRIQLSNSFDGIRMDLKETGKETVPPAAA